MYSIEELATDFRKLGIRAGDTVMLHASVRAVGEVAGGPDVALKSALTSEGTLMMYASCPRYVFWGKQSEYLMSSQPWDYALGSDSPLERFLMLDGKLVLLGSDHDAVTFLHYVEHVADIPGQASRPSQGPFRSAFLALRCLQAIARPFLRGELDPENLQGTCHGLPQSQDSA